MREEVAKEGQGHERAVLDRIIVSYEDASAIQDITNILNIINPPEEDKQTGPGSVFEWGHTCELTRVLKAAEGQCLDPNVRSNSIDNSQYLMGVMDPTWNIDVANDMEGRFRADIISGIMPATINGVRQAAIVTDRFYVPDGSPHTWSKKEGHLEHLLTLSDKMGLPLVIPEVFLEDGDRTPFLEWQKKTGRTFERMSEQVSHSFNETEIKPEDAQNILKLANQGDSTVDEVTPGQEKNTWKVKRGSNNYVLEYDDTWKGMKIFRDDATNGDEPSKTLLEEMHATRTPDGIMNVHSGIPMDLQVGPSGGLYFEPMGYDSYKSDTTINPLTNQVYIPPNCRKIPLVEQKE